MIKTFFKGNKDDPFKRALLAVGIPVALQHLIQTALNLIDTIMIGRVSKDALAAVGLANQVFFLMILLAFGINSGVSVYIAQFWGKKDVKNIRKTIGVGLTGGLIVSMFFFLSQLPLSRASAGTFLKRNKCC
ncbi:MATE family efflux transporter [Fusibacter sp. JL216-2]|uniref:MATE family efflux transporter n=1 Tax=Fusibacter sp. JL216-2 TaxID=3071453 RepID=UPI003D325F3A